MEKKFWEEDWNKNKKYYGIKIDFLVYSSRTDKNHRFVSIRSSGHQDKGLENCMIRKGEIKHEKVCM